MRFPRFRVRTLMIAVAAVAMLLGAALVIKRRRAEFQKLAAKHDLAAIFAGRRTEYIVESQGFWMPVDLSDEDTELVRLQVERHTMLAEKYQWAARYPFLPVSSDLPGPTRVLEPLLRKIEPPPLIRRGDSGHNGERGPLQQIPVPEEFIPGKDYRQ